MKSNIDRIIDKMNFKNIQRNQVVSIEEIKEFEKNFDISLPEELILFYTKISNGCKMIDGFDLLNLTDWKYNIEHLKDDFMFDKYWIWESNYDEEKIAKITYGNIELIDIGDAQTWNIIVNGNEKGKMWFFSDVGIQPCAPSMNFLEWFEYWLDGNEDFFYDFQF